MHRFSGGRGFAATLVGGILFVGAVAAVSGFVAIESIDRRLSSRAGGDADAFLHSTMDLQFRLTQAIEESFAYLVSGDAKERQEFEVWNARFPAHHSSVESLMATQTRSGQDLLESIATDQGALFDSAQELFAQYEQSGRVTLESFHAYEAVVDRILQHTQELTALGHRAAEAERQELIEVLDSSKSTVRRAALVSGLLAILVAGALLRLLYKERSARARAEQAVELSNQNYRDLYDNAPDMHISVDTASRRIVACNSTTVETLGYARDRIVGMPVLDVYAQDSRPLAKDTLRSFSETGSASANHLQLVSASGELIDVSLRASAVRDRQGRVVRSRSVWRDIRSQLEAEKALKASEERYRSLVQGAPVCIHEIDRDGKLITMNPAGLAMLGKSDVSEIAGAPYLSFVTPDDRARISDLMRRALAGESIEFEFEPESGKYFQSSFTPIRDFGGRVVRLMGVTQDLTAHRNNEIALRQKAKMEAVGQLAGGIAHDFNNLLTIITGYCEDLGKRLDADSWEQQSVRHVAQAAEQAAALTRQLLAFSRNQEQAIEFLDLNEVVRGLEPMLGRLVGEDVLLRTKLDRRLDAVRASPGQIEQILVNLAANARDAMPRGGTLAIETRAVDDRVQLIVTDTGVGMNPELRERVFEPFFTTKTGGKGSGLGLSTVLGIVEQNGGEIDLATVPGKGTQVTVKLPGAGRPALRTESAARPGELEGTETILLAEDQQEVRALVRRALEIHGYRVLEARDGVEALSIARVHSDSIELLVTDVVMPRMNGVELAERLTQVLAEVKVVFVSGFTGGEIGSRMEMPRDAPLLNKPFLPSELLATVRKVLDADAARAQRSQRAS